MANEKVKIITGLTGVEKDVSENTMRDYLMDHPDMSGAEIEHFSNGVNTGLKIAEKLIKIHDKRDN